MLGNGKCKCLSGIERDLMLNSLKRSIREETKIIDDIRETADILERRGRKITVSETINAQIKILQDFEQLKTKVENTPVCELMVDKTKT